MGYLRGEHLKSEQGIASLLSVAVLSMILVSSLASVHVYLVNRAKYQAKIRDAYQSTFVMEDLSKLVNSAIETCANSTCNPNQANGTGVNGGCPGGTVRAHLPGAVVGGNRLYGCFPSCSGGNPNYCVQNSRGQPFCLQDPANISSATQPCDIVTSNEYAPESAGEYFAQDDGPDFLETAGQFLAALSQEGLFVTSAHAQTAGTQPGQPPTSPTPGTSATPTPPPAQTFATPNCNTGGAVNPQDQTARVLCQTCNGNNCQTFKTCYEVGGSGAGTQRIPGRRICSTQVLRLDERIAGTPTPTPTP